MNVTRFGPAPLGLAFGASSIFAKGAVTDLRFDLGRYRLGGATAPAAAIDGYHTRGSARWAERADAAWQEFATGSAPILPGRGYDSREGHTVLNVSPLNPGSGWGVEAGGTIAPISGTYLGFSDAAVFASNGQVFHRARSTIADNTIVNGGVYAVRAIYAAGTSPNARVHLRAVSIGQDIQAQGPLGSLTPTSQGAGSISNLENISHGGGIYECRFIATVNAASATWNLAVGPASDVLGQTVIIVAAQIVQRPYQVPFGSGTVASDSMTIPAADAGMAINPSVSGLTMFWRGRDYPSAAGFPKLLDIRDQNDHRLSFERQVSDGVFRPVFSGPAGVSTALNFGTLAQLPYGTEYTALATWRADGSVWLKAGAVAASTGTGRTMMTGTPSVIGVGNSATGSDFKNCVTRRCGLLPYSLSDGDALALFNRVNEGLL